MNTIGGTSTDTGTSGYTGNIEQELESVVPMQSETEFSHINESYVSTSGHTRLFTAMRYGKQYMLKGIKPDFLYIPVYRQALIKEFEIGLQLDHPNICRTIGMEEICNYGSMIIMEHIDGDTLQKLIDSGKLDAETARRIARQLADALDYMHSKQIIHRDLKPSNIMITHNGHNAKIIDFSLSDSDSFAVLKQPAGTSGYIAPEQFLPNAKSNIESDIYSFGMVVRKMADATGDKQLEYISKACTNRNPSARPVNKQQIFNLRRDKLRQRMLLLFLAAVSTFLAIYIGVTLHRYNTFTDEEGQNKDGNTLNGENSVEDIYTWPVQKRTYGSKH